LTVSCAGQASDSGFEGAATAAGAAEAGARGAAGAGVGAGVAAMATIWAQVMAASAIGVRIAACLMRDGGLAASWVRPPSLGPVGAAQRVDAATRAEASREGATIGFWHPAARRAIPGLSPPGLAASGR